MTNPRAAAVEAAARALTSQMRSRENTPELCASAAIAAYEARMAEAGWVMVPKDATPEMRKAGAFGPTTISQGDEYSTFEYISEDNAAELWADMVDAAMMGGKGDA